MINRLFVYGTLGPGQSHEHLLTQVPGQWCKAEIKAKLYPNGLGLSRGYPIVDLANPETVIEGYIYSSDQLPRLWQLLDDYEGDGYRRVVTTATVVATAAQVQTYIYCH